MTRPDSPLRAPADSAPDACAPTSETDISQFVQRGRPYVAGEMPASLRAFIEPRDPDCREALLCRLLFAARDLAEMQIEPADGVDTAFCSECTADECEGVIAHDPVCRTGRVLRIIAELCKSAALDSTRKEAATGERIIAKLCKVAALDSTRKEAATGEQQGSAGGGNRPRGLIERVCLKCGVRDGNWDAVQRPESQVLLSELGLNQCVSAGENGKGHTLYTHRCGEGFEQGGIVASDQPLIFGDICTDCTLPKSIAEKFEQLVPPEGGAK